MTMTFDGPYDFLSNFYPSPIKFRVEKDIIIAATAEHAFQALKTLDPAERRWVLGAPTPGAAKRLGQQVNKRIDWEQVRVFQMKRVLKRKFSDPELARRLIETGEIELVEGNHWGDTFWGVCRGVGENQLGQLLMAIRQDLNSFGRPVVPHTMD